MPLGTEVDLGPGHIVLDGDSACLPQKGHSPPQPMSVVAKLLVDSPSYTVIFSVTTLLVGHQEEHLACKN